MLVLTRRLGETIRIGDKIAIQVVDIGRGSVRVAIDAPREIPVHREEVYHLVRDENRSAACTTTASAAARLFSRGQSTKGSGR